MIKIYILILAITISFQSYAYRCGQKLITTDSSMLKALNYCGEPLNHTSYDKSVCRWLEWSGMRVCTQIKVDVLTYKRSGATTRLIFHNNLLYTTESCRVC